MASFDRIANLYDRLKRLVFGDQVDKATRHYLKEIPENCTILIIGGGTGSLLADFKSTHHIKYLELSEAMINKAKKVSCLATVDFMEADVLEWIPSEEVDYIVTPFVLDCFNESQLTSVLRKLKKALKKNGKWIQTDFYPKGRRQKVLVGIMYAFFILTVKLKTNRLADFDQFFKKFGFSSNRKASFFHSMIESKIYQQIE